MSLPTTIASRAPSGWLAALAAVVVPLSLLWDYSWEFTIGVETAWAPPHVATYGAMMMAMLLALAGLIFCTKTGQGGVRLGRLRAPFGSWMVLWGGAAFAVAVVLDRWWQVGYGQAAGIWHPPQLLKAVAFFAVLIGTWIGLAHHQRGASGAWAFSMAGGVLLAMIFVVTLPACFANRQHSAALYEIACGTYPVVLVAAALAGRWRFSATATAACYLLIAGAAVWLLPLQPAVPQTGPIFNPRDHLLPPPFPLLLIAPALALDLLLRVFPGKGREGGRAFEVAVAFFFVFAAVQWPFAGFLLSPASAGGLFAGGGRHWPPFQPIGPQARVSFWPAPGFEFTTLHALLAIGLAVMASAIGLWLGAKLKRLR